MSDGERFLEVGKWVVRVVDSARMTILQGQKLSQMKVEGKHGGRRRLGTR